MESESESESKCQGGIVGICLLLCFSLFLEIQFDLFSVNRCFQNNCEIVEETNSSSKNCIIICFPFSLQHFNLYVITYTSVKRTVIAKVT